MLWLKKALLCIHIRACHHSGLIGRKKIECYWPCGLLIVVDKTERGKEVTKKRRGSFGSFSHKHPALQYGAPAGTLHSQLIAGEKAVRAANKTTSRRHPGFSAQVSNRAIAEGDNSTPAAYAFVAKVNNDEERDEDAERCYDWVPVNCVCTKETKQY